MVAYGHHVGMDMFLFNLTNPWTYWSIFATTGFIPIIALARYKAWPPVLRRFFWLLIPAWVVIHLFLATIAEARLFLVPYSLVILPAAFARTSDIDP